MWVQHDITLPAVDRGFHLITQNIIGALPEVAELRVGLLHLFIRHTSASLTLNESASPDVRRDFRTWFDVVVPEKVPFWTHTQEGPDDMPAHIKSSLTDSSVTIPIKAGRLSLGTWQGIYLCEHRNHAPARKLVATVWGE